MKYARTLSLALLAAAVGASGCASNVKPIPPVAHVDINRFMGSWYVIALIPSFLEKHEYNAVESYQLRPDGRIQTTFRYRKGSFTAPLKTMHPIGTVRPGTGNAIWGMQIVWPIQAEYVIVDLKPDYSEVMIGAASVITCGSWRARRALRRPTTTPCWPRHARSATSWTTCTRCRSNGRNPPRNSCLA